MQFGGAPDKTSDLADLNMLSQENMAFFQPLSYKSYSKWWGLLGLGEDTVWALQSAPLVVPVFNVHKY